MDTRLLALAVSVILAGGLCGCATFRKCGLAGCADDAKITAQIQALFVQHPSLEAPNSVNVQTLDHVVYLYGLVNTDLERALAETVARQATGVLNVVNSIGISGGR